MNIEEITALGGPAMPRTPRLKEPPAGIIALLPAYCEEHLHEIVLVETGRWLFLHHADGAPSGCGCDKVEKRIATCFAEHSAELQLQNNRPWSRLTVQRLVNALITDVPYFWLAVDHSHCEA